MPSLLVASGATTAGSVANSTLVGQTGAMKSFRFSAAFLASLLCVSNCSRGDDSDNPFVGGWALTLPGDQKFAGVVTGWLGVETDGKGIDAQMLDWDSGSVLKLDAAHLDGQKLVLTRLHEEDSKRPDGQTAKIKLTDTITVTRDGDSIKLVSVTPKADGSGEDRSEFTGKRLPPMPPAPILRYVKFGDPVQ